MLYNVFDEFRKLSAQERHFELVKLSSYGVSKYGNDFTQPFDEAEALSFYETLKILEEIDISLFNQDVPSSSSLSSSDKTAP